MAEQNDNSIAKTAFTELFPEKSSNLSFSLKYSGKLKNYNSHVRYGAGFIEFKLSRKWLDVSEEIKIGLFQSLLLRVFREKKETFYIDLYRKFLSRIPDYSEKTRSDPLLEESFNRVNEQYFAGMIEKPNLAWAEKNLSKLGSYEFGSDTIMISNVFTEEPDLLDYVMYHEILHKRHKFELKDGRSRYHTTKFRADEKKWHDPDAEKKLEKFLKKARLKNLFFG